MPAAADYDSIEWGRVRRLTFVPFLDDGRCVLVPASGRLVLPWGEVQAGEDPMLDTGLRVPLATAGFRRQGFHPFAVEGDHVYVWCEGHDRYRGWRPHAEVELWTGPAAEAARRLRAAGDELAAAVVEGADRARRSLDEEAFYRDSQRLLETSYLRDGTPRGGSGFGGTAAAWRAQRAHIGQGIHRSRTGLGTPTRCCGGWASGWTAAPGQLTAPSRRRRGSRAADAWPPWPLEFEDDSRSAPTAATGAQLPKLICDITMSLDGFITGPNPSVEHPLGQGTRLFGHLGADPVDLEITRVVESPAVTHLIYRVLG